MTIPDSVSMAAPREDYWFEWTMEDGGATLIKTDSKWPHQKDNIYNLKNEDYLRSDVWASTTNGLKDKFALVKYFVRYDGITYKSVKESDSLRVQFTLPEQPDAS